MWILWMISLISLIVCAIFAYRMIVSSYEFLPSDQRFLWRTGKKKEEENTPVPLNTDYFKNINRKIHSLEDNTSFYHLQIAKLEERLNALELHIPAKNKFQPTPEKFEEENWKELFYEENEKKEKLENELDKTTQLLNEAREKLNILSEKDFHWVELESDYEGRLAELHSLQSQVETLKKQLLASEEREKELENLIISEIVVREKYSVLKKEYVSLKSEVDDLRRRMIELGKKEIQMEMRLVQIGELESKLAFCEEEKSKLRARLENHLLG